MFIQENEGEFIVCRTKGKLNEDAKPSRKQIVTDWFRVTPFIRIEDGTSGFINVGRIRCPKKLNGKKVRLKLVVIKNEPIVRRKMK